MKSTIQKLIADLRFPTEGYGFIKSPDAGKNYYFAYSDLTNCAFVDLHEGDIVEFTPVDESGNRKAKSVTLAKRDSKTPRPEIAISSANQLSEALVSILAKIDGIGDPSEFENTILLLFKLLGVHKIYQYDPDDAAGKPDGFFILGNLAVIYDCTLRSDYMSFKNEQIDNYVNKLSNKSQLTIDTRRVDGGKGSKTLQISGRTRQVWIITKGASRELHEVDEIKVKEVSLKDLLTILKKRLNDITFEEDDLSREFMLLGK